MEIIETEIQCSFFSGNSNWFGLLSGKLSEIDFSDLDLDQTEANIQSQIFETDGVVFPVVDTGVLVTRGFRLMKVEDFVAGIHAKNIFKRIFQKYSIKIQGELLNDPHYNTLIIMKNSRSQDQLNANACFVQKINTTARPVELDFYKITFDNDTTFPYFDGENNNFDLTNSKFIAPEKMRVDIEVALEASIVDASYNNRIYLYINGVFTFVDIGLSVGGLYNTGEAGDIEIHTIKRSIVLEKNDQLEIYSQWQQSVGSTQNDILRGTLKITPTYLFKVHGNSIVPNWSQQEFVSNIISIFNVITAYDVVSKTLTLNLFEKVNMKEPIDISDHVSRVEVDYSEFISSYGKRNLFSYQEVDFDDLRLYNISNFFKYSQGVVNCANDFLEDSVDVLESDFSNPVSYLNGVFDMSMERLNLIELEEGDTVDITSVTSNLTNARFNISNNIFLLSDLVRISECTNPKYNGDWMINTLAAGYVQLSGDGFNGGMTFDTNATGKITKLNFKYSSSDDVYLLIHIPLYTVSNFSGHSNIRIENTDNAEVSTAFFNLLNTGRIINSNFKQSLSFGEITSPYFYQRTMLQTYWSMFERILNDPVKLRTDNYLPWKVHNNIDFLRPLMIKTLETTNLYYLNLERGYKASHLLCETELIKLP